jgi:glycerophosphoryl diester phosphodiesterase
LVVEAVRGARLTRRTTIQSFDWRTLLEVKKRAPEIEAVCLTYAKTLEDRRDGDSRKPSAWLAGLDPAAYGRSVPRLAAAAGCGTWSPYFRELNAAAVTEAHGLSLKVVPWTVNSAEDMAGIIDMKVDGLITDYPDRARAVMAQRGLPLP